MPSVKVKFSYPSAHQTEGKVIFQIIHRRVVALWVSDFSLLPSQWDAKRSIPIVDGPDRDHLVLVHEGIRCDLDRFRRVFRDLSDSGAEFSSQDIIAEFARRRESQSLFRFIERIALNFKQMGRIRTSETYRAALNSFRNFRKGEDVMFDCFDAELMECYQSWLSAKGLIPNSISFYMRILRAVYNRAVEQGITADRHPFRHVCTGVYKTVKRAVPLDVIRSLKQLDLSLLPQAMFARDIFFMSFYLRGMSFVDMAFLKRSDLSSGKVSYRRRKTGQRLSVKWTAQMQEILDRYPPNSTPYLLPIITRPDISDLRQYRSCQFLVNKWLKRLGELIGLKMPLTLYCSRHSWASIARQKGIPISVISEGLGHDNELTTQIYLSTLDSNAVDRANDLILNLL